jgi:hypothetical protein
LEQFNSFVFALNNRMQHLPVAERQRRMGIILQDLGQTDVFTPINDMSDDEDDEFEKEEEEACDTSMSHEQRIRELTAIYSNSGIPEDEEETQEEVEREYVVKKRRGNRDLHEAVRMNDVVLVTNLIAAGADPHEKNNSGYSAVDLAFLEENEEIISVFRTAGCLPSVNAA